MAAEARAAFHLKQTGVEQIIISNKTAKTLLKNINFNTLLQSPGDAFQKKGLKGKVTSGGPGNEPRDVQMKGLERGRASCTPQDGQPDTALDQVTRDGVELHVRWVLNARDVSLLLVPDLHYVVGKQRNT